MNGDVSNRTPDPKDPSGLEQIARQECKPLLGLLEAQFSPSAPLEALIIIAFSLGAGWALGLDMDLEAYLVGAHALSKDCDHSVVMTGSAGDYKRRWCGKCGATLTRPSRHFDPSGQDGGEQR